MGKLALEVGIEDIFEQRCRAHRRQVSFGGRGSGKEGDGVEENAVMEEEDRGAKSHW